MQNKLAQSFDNICTKNSKRKKPNPKHHNVYCKSHGHDHPYYKNFNNYDTIINLSFHP